MERFLTHNEEADIDGLNALLYRRLAAAREAMIKESGLSAPQSVTMMLGQVSDEDLMKLGRIKTKGKSGKK